MFFRLYRSYKERWKYSTYDRAPFFELAQRYMPKDAEDKGDVENKGLPEVRLYPGAEKK